MSITDINSDEAKEARRRTRRELRECEGFLDSALFKKRDDLTERLGEADQLDERVRFVYDGPIGWRVVIERRADGTMPIRVANDGVYQGQEKEATYVRETRDGDVNWLEANLP